jgi:hypothetical protein
MDMLHPPFRDGVVDGVWFAQAFEYVPPDKREIFLKALGRITHIILLTRPRRKISIQDPKTGPTLLRT